MSDDGQLTLANEWGLVPSRLGISADKLPEIPSWSTSLKVEETLDAGNYHEPIFMDFDQTSTWPSQKAKNEDMWYNMFSREQRAFADRRRVAGSR